MNYKVNMQISKSEWGSNSCVYATEKEAFEAGRELMSRWMVPIGHSTVKTSDPVNYRFNFETYKTESIKPWNQ